MNTKDSAGLIESTVRHIGIVGLLLSMLGCANNETADAQRTSPAANISWVVLEPGPFTMGSPVDEWGRADNEILHTVEQVHRFEIAQTEITFKQWRMLDIAAQLDVPTVPISLLEADSESDELDNGATDNMPVSITSIEAVTRWLDALSVESGFAPCYAEQEDWPTPIHCPGYRLPTESEWERAARGGDSRATYNGDFSGDNYTGDMPQALESIAWCGSRTAPYDANVPQTVGKLEPNSFGLYDMIGNVAEWTRWEGIYPSEPTQSGTGLLVGEFFTARGGSAGSFGMQFYGCRAASRGVPHASNATLTNDTGFRPVRTLPESTLPTVPSNTPCALSSPSENCDGVAMPDYSVLRAATPGATYVDIQKIDDENNLAVLGQSDTAGPFVEWFPFSGITDLSVSPITLEALSPQLSATHLRAAIEGNAAMIAVLCEAAQCGVYSVPASFSDSLYITAVEGGDIPSWVGDVQDVAYRSSPFEVWVSGRGIARFTGTEWTQIADDTTPLMKAMDAKVNSNGETIVAAAGENGYIGIQDESGWRAIQTDSQVTFNDVSVQLSTTGISIYAVGASGTFIHGPIDALQSCTLSTENLSDLSYPVTESGFAIYSESGALYIQPPVVYGLPSCLGEPLPPGAIATTGYSCGGMDRNMWYLTPNGIIGDTSLGNGVHCTTE